LHLPTERTTQFDDVVRHVEEIGRLNGASASALVIVQRGRIVTEAYQGFHSFAEGARPVQADSQFNVASARKSYIGLAVAWALHAGAIRSLDDRVTAYLPELDRDVLDGTTIRHLLTHTHGLTRNEAGAIVRDFVAGRGWSYQNVNIELLTDLVERTTGQTVAGLLADKVFGPLGFTETGWRMEARQELVGNIEEPEQPAASGLGYNADGAGDQRNLFVSAREFAYWGYLHLQKGRIDGEQVVPEEVVRIATSVQSPILPDPDLPQQGFLWYVKDRDPARSEIGEQVPAGSYQILGITGPLLLVVPEHELVVARMYNKQFNYGGDKGYLHYLREFGNRVMDGVMNRVRGGV
jgi:CubicO group peptidase (beta-lactamase class C family)